MSNTKKKGGRGPGAGGRGARGRAALTFCLLPFAFFLNGCRMDMQDQPRYEYYEPSAFFADGQSSRPLVEGTVPRGHLRDSYLYTGKGAPGGVGGQGGMSGGTAAAPTSTGGAAQGGLVQPSRRQALTQGGAVQGGGDVNRRGNVAGGIPGGSGNMTAANPAAGANAAAAAIGGPDVFPFPIDEAAIRRGRNRYDNFCAMCHGPAGDGDGLIWRRGFQKPASLHEDRLQEGQAAAAHFFDVMTNGWGAMPAYNYMLSAEDRWKVVAYIRALQLSRRMNVNELSPEARARVLEGARKNGHNNGGRPTSLPVGVEQPHRGGERH